MPVLNRQYSSAAASGPNTVALNTPPGAGGGVGPNYLTIDHISGYFICSAITSPAQIALTVTPSVGSTPFVTRFAVTGTSTPVPFNIVFPEGTGPRIDDAGLATTVVLSVVSSSAVLSNNFVGVGYHFEP